MLKITSKDEYRLSLGDHQNEAECLKLIKAFFDESPYRDSKFSGKKIKETIQGLSKDTANSLVLVANCNDKPIGILIGTISEMLFSEELVASELCWYVDPEHRNSRIGLQMFQAFEYWAKEKQKVDHIVMVHLDDENGEKLTHLYNKKGYKKKEQAYMRTL